MNKQMGGEQKISFARECYSKEQEKEIQEFQAKFGGSMSNENGDAQDGGCNVF